jgi:hypothetical protein
MDDRRDLLIEPAMAAAQRLYRPAGLGVAFRQPTRAGRPPAPAATAGDGNHGGGQEGGWSCRGRGCLVIVVRDCLRSGEEERMKYVMLIYQGNALEQQAALPAEQQSQVYADYQGINQTPGVTPALPMGRPENATTVRVEGGKTLTTAGPFVG